MDGIVQLSRNRMGMDRFSRFWHHDRITGSCQSPATPSQQIENGGIMNMQQAIEGVFTSLPQDQQKNFKASEEGSLADSSRPVNVGASGSKEFEFQIDANGNFSASTEVYGAGVTVNAKGVILDPNAVFSITIIDSDGGGGHWENIHAGQQVSCALKTSFWHKTKITVSGHSSIPGVTGHGRLDYSY